MAKKTEETKDLNLLNLVRLELVYRIFPLIVKFNLRAMAKTIKKEHGVSLTEKDIECALLDILWHIHETNPNIADRKIRTKSRGKITFELSFCPVRDHEINEDDFNKLLRSTRVNKPVGT